MDIINLIKASTLLILSNLFIGITMSLVYFIGNNSLLSDLIIYGPILGILFVLIRDKFTFSYVISSILSIAHGYAHKVYPFLNEFIGVDRTVDVWQDQILHLGQIILFTSLYYTNSNNYFKKTYLLLILGNIINVVTGFLCWGKACHNIYVGISILPALSSGLHFAIGTLYHTNIEVANYGFFLQGMASVMTYFMFKKSDEILKLFALCRFFEIYFIVPHYIGYFNSRYQIVREMNNISYFDRLMYFLGCYSLPLSIKNLPLLESYFNQDKKKIN